jgi:hypothetical protein
MKRTAEALPYRFLERGAKHGDVRIEGRRSGFGHDGSLQDFS